MVTPTSTTPCTTEYVREIFPQPVLEMTPLTLTANGTAADWGEGANADGAGRGSATGGVGCQKAWLAASVRDDGRRAEVNAGSGEV